MKLALERADPVIYNVERTWVAIAVLFAVLSWRGPIPPSSRRPGGLMPENRGSPSSSPASSRRRSTSARRRWRWRAGGAGRTRCWSSRCRSGRCSLPGRCCTNASAAASGGDRVRARGTRAGRRAMGLVWRPDAEVWAVLSGSGGRPGQSRPSITSGDMTSTS